MPVLFILLGAYALWEAAGMSDLAAVFPRTVAAVMVLAAVALIVLELRRPRGAGGEPVHSWPRSLGVVLVMVAWPVLLTSLGFVASSLVAFAALLLIAEQDGWTPRRAVGYGASGAIAIGLAWLALTRILNVPMPGGLLF
jgi:putative tricarboxylic transport membrane protein